jgi:hypothetical protein
VDPHRSHSVPDCDWWCCACPAAGAMGRGLGTHNILSNNYNTRGALQRTIVLGSHEKCVISCGERVPQATFVFGTKHRHALQVTGHALHMAMTLG